MASSRATPFIASWDAEDPLDATAPLDDILSAPPATDRVPAVRAPPAPSRIAWSVLGIAATLAVGAILGMADLGISDHDAPSPPALARPDRIPPPPIRAELRTFPVRIDATSPRFASSGMEEPQPTPSRTRPSARDELAAALLERRQQLARSGDGGENVDAVAAIHFDPSRRSARVVYHVHDSSAEVVEYWALRDGRWQPLDD